MAGIFALFTAASASARYRGLSHRGAGHRSNSHTEGRDCLTTYASQITWWEISCQFRSETTQVFSPRNMASSLRNVTTVHRASSFKPHAYPWTEEITSYQIENRHDNCWGHENIFCEFLFAGRIISIRIPSSKYGFTR
jgi:hypothetical protein